MRLTNSYERQRARLELVPLLDVIFLLLASFVYASATLSWSKAVKVNLPRGQGESAPQTLAVITISKDGSLSFNSRTVGIEEAVSEAARLNLEQGQKVIVRGDRSATLGIAVELLSKLKVAGVDSVSFEVRDMQ